MTNQEIEILCSILPLALSGGLFLALIATRFIDRGDE